MTEGWDDPIKNGDLCRAIADAARRLASSDPVGGPWNVDANVGFQVWVDASSIVIGVMLEGPNGVVEDASWLRGTGELDEHINLAELDAIIRGINLLIQWRGCQATIYCDSQTATSWVQDCLSGVARLCTKASSEAFI